MSQNDEKLKTLPKELFQLDQPDLLFDRYRVQAAHSPAAKAIRKIRRFPAMAGAGAG